MSQMFPALNFITPTQPDTRKPLFVYFPGLDGSGELFASQIADLQPHVDIRCLKLAQDDLSPWDELATQALALINQEARDRPLYLCGESFGACLALQVVAKAPTLARHLILVNSASCFHQLPWLQWVVNLTTWATSPLYESIYPHLYKTSTLGSLPLLANLSRISRSQQAALLDAMGAVSKATLAWRLALLHQFRLEPLNLQRVTAQTLIVASQSDRLLPSMAEARRLATLLPNAHIHLLPYSGHISLLEDGISLGQILAHFGALPSRPLTSLAH